MRRLASAVCPLFLCLSFVSAQTPSVLKQVDDHYNHLTSLRCRYTEHYAGMGFDRTESGTLTLQKPGRMRWDYDTPAGKLFLLNGKFAWFYAPGDSQASRIPAKQIDDLRTPLRFLLGHTQLQKELQAVTVTFTPAGAHITGTPKGMSVRIRQLSLDVTPTGQITAMKIEEQDGATTEFNFSGIRENLPIPAGEFTFTPPSGVAIISGTPPI